MNWSDTVGQAIHSEMFNLAIKQKPDADPKKLHQSIIRTGLSVGATREAIAKVLDAEIAALIAYRILGDNVPVEFIAGISAASELVRYGVHVTDTE
jgi:hypothetical protein